MLKIIDKISLKIKSVLSIISINSSSNVRLPKGQDILYDKFHVMKHLGEAMDKIRKLEYK